MGCGTFELWTCDLNETMLLVKWVKSSVDRWNGYADASTGLHEWAGTGANT